MEGLKALAYANGFTLWYYETADAAVDGVGYFDKAAHLFAVDDVIFASRNGGGDVGLVAVKSNNGGVVTVGAFVPISQAAAGGVAKGK